MITNNLIRLGALAQIHYSMADGFRIMRLADDYAYRDVRLAIPARADYNTGEEVASFSNGCDTIQLEKVGFTDNLETIWAGYSSLCNVFVYQERRGEGKTKFT